jgi:hypothetical protein
MVGWFHYFGPGVRWNIMVEGGGRQETESQEEEGTKYLQRPAPSDLLPLLRPHLLKVPAPPKIASSSGDQPSIHEPFERTSIKTIIVHTLLQLQ